MKTIIRVLIVFFYGVLAISIGMGASITVYAVAETEWPDPINAVVELTGYEVEGGYIEAGKETTILLTIKNENAYYDAHNIVLSASSASGMIFPKYGNSNRTFVGDLNHKMSTTVKIPVAVASELTAEYADINFDIIYESGDFKYTNNASILIPTHLISEINVNSLDVSKHPTINSKSLLSISYTNNTNKNISDAVLVVEGNVSEDTQQIDLGNIAADKTYIKDFDIVFTEAGEQSIIVKLKYTNVNGEYIEDELGDYTVDVRNENDFSISNYSRNAILVWLGRALALVSTIGALLVTVIYVRKR